MVEHAPNDAEARPLLPRTPKSEALPIAISTFAILLVGNIGAFIANADTSFVIATYASIASEFGNVSRGPWLLVGYTLGYSVALPIYGAVSDFWGRKPPLLAAYLFFAVGCVISSGAATELWQIILGRLVSGAGGAGMTAMIAVIITDMATPSEVAVLRSYINVVAITGRSSGGPIGGILTDIVGWRWSFLGQSVFAIILCGLIAVLLPSKIKRKEGIATRVEGNSVKPAKKKRSVDFPGLLLFAAMLIGFLLTLDLAGRGVSIRDTVMMFSLVLLVTSGIAFFMIEKYLVEKPLIPYSLLKNKGFGVQLLIQILLLNSQFSIVSNLGTYFVRTENASNSVAALHIVPVAIGNAIGALVAGRLIKRTKRYKTISMVALAICSLGYFVIALRWRGHINIWESLYVFATSFGVGAVNSTQFVSVSAGAPKDRMATAVSLFFLSQQVGMMIGASTSSSLLQYVFRAKLTYGLDGVGPDEDTILRRVLNEARYAFILPEHIQGIVMSAYVKGFFTISIWSLCSSAIIQPLVIALKEQAIE